MTSPKPIPYARDTWLCLRHQLGQPVAIISRQRREGQEYFRVITWDLGPTQ